MIKEITRYPSKPSIDFGVNVKVFNDYIISILEDLKDTIIENNLDGLTAFQIGNYHNIVVVKEENGNFLELINPLLIKMTDKLESVETTAYFPEISAKVVRHKRISVSYQDRLGVQKYIQADGDLSILLQRKIDYTFGSTFLEKLSPNEKKLFEKKLKFGSNFATASDTCASTLKSDYLIKISKIFILFMFILLVISIFIGSVSTLKIMWNIQLVFVSIAGLLNVGYFFYSHYEAKKYMSCTSCQSGNIIGTVGMSMIKLCILMLVSYFVL